MVHLLVMNVFKRHVYFINVYISMSIGHINYKC